MALGLMALVAKLTLDKTEYEKGIESAGDALKKGLSNAAKLGAAAIGAATTAVVAFGKSSIDTGMEFDKSMSQVAATMNKTTDEIEDLREFAQKMGRETAFSAVEAADALNYMALAGYDAETSMKMLPNVLNLAAAGNIDLASASDMVTDAQSALGLSLDQTNVMVDQMAMASSKTNTSVAQLGEGMLTIGATARNMKGGTTELATTLGILADNGIKGAEGGTHLRNVILSLQTPSDKGTVALKKLGLSYSDMYDSAGKMRSIPEIMLLLQSRMEGMTQASRDAIISGLFNKQDLASVNALLGTNKDRWVEVYGAITDSAGAAERMKNTQLDNLAGDVTLFKSALEGAKIIISDQLTPTLRGFVQFGTQALSTLSDAFKEGGLSGAMDALGAILSEGLNMIIAAVPKVIDAGMQLLGALGTGLLQNLPMIIDAINQVIVMLAQAIISALPSVAQAGAQILMSLASGLSQSLPQIIPAALQAVMQVVTTIFEAGPELNKAGNDLMLALIEGILASIPRIVSSLPQLIQSMLDFLLAASTNFMNAGVELLTSLVFSMPIIIQTIVDALPPIITSIVNFIIQSIPQLVQAGVKLLTSLISDLPFIISSIVSAIPQIISGILGALTDSIPQIVKAGVELLVSIVSDLPHIIVEIVKAVPEIIKSIVSALGQGVGEMAKAGLNLIKGLWNGIKDAGSWLWGKVSGFLGGILDKIKGFFGIHSPSTVFAGIGKYLDEGLGKGIEDNADSAMKPLLDIADDMSNISFNPSLSASGAYGSGHGYGSSNSIGAVTININGAGRNAEDIAHEVERVFVRWQNQERLAFA